MERISRLIFVCSGNTCRSPMAAAIAADEIKKRGLNAIVSSAGIQAEPGSHATPEAVRVCAENGLDISGHRASPIREGVEDDKTLFVTVSRAHASWLRYVCMVPCDRILVLGEDVPDPYGGGDDIYRRTYNELDRLVTELLDRIGSDIAAAEGATAPASDDAPADIVYEIVPMDSVNVRGIAELEAMSFDDPWSFEMLYEELDNTDAEIVAARNPADGTIYGYGGVIIGGDLAQITRICVRDDVRRRGIASAILAELARLSKEHGASELSLEVRVSNVGAIALYSKTGFADMGIRPGFYSSPKEDARIMTLKLSDNAAEE